ncbi:MAG: DNA translocase FtsK 4TM domain-containing protein [Fimbriimonadaceae bacterium]|nr:DNA translocase FtsK 4TM domain-containing protein [Fimbriimonadaceae bacterium]
MAAPSSTRRTRNVASSAPEPPAAWQEVVGCAQLGLALVLLIGFMSEPGVGLRWVIEAAQTVGGKLCYALPVLCAYAGWQRLRQPAQVAPGLSRGAVLLGALAVAGLLHLRVPAGEEWLPTALGSGLLHPPQQYGGYLGLLLLWLLRGLVGPAAAAAVLGTMAVTSLILASQRSVRELLEAVGSQVAARRLARRQRLASRPPRALPQRQSAALAPVLDLPPALAPTPPRLADEAWPAAESPAEDLPDLPLPRYLLPSAPAVAASPAEPVPPPAAPLETAVESVEPAAPLAAPVAVTVPAVPALGAWAGERALVRDPVPLDRDPTTTQLVLPGMPVPERSAAEAAWFSEGEPLSYRVPPLDLMKPALVAPLPDRTPEILANIERLERTLASFKISARVVNHECGPTVTRYEMELGEGIRVNKVAVLENDIAYALASDGIRIEAPVPGKGVVGIEVPNQIRETVHLHDLLLSREFQAAPGPLPFVLGKDIAGHLKIAELTRMPHALVAGTTNSGKSVCLNCIIISLLYRLSPRDLRFLMIDPKRVELTLYDGIPHLDRPVVTDPEDAADLLRGAVREMMARYDRLHDLGVRNIASYNAQVDEDDRMPYIVIIIDELAELMMLARAEVEASICRLAQLARATGIHLVVATQRPAVNVVTGQIKANIGTRIAFSVAQQVDSRVILDQVGAERLIGRGDMLYSPIDGSKPERLQGAFVDEAQVHRLVEFLQAMPSSLRVQYAESIIQPVAADTSEEEASAVTEGDLDDLFWECVDFVRLEGEGSTSRLQRNYGIGYNRAGRIMDQMCRMGIVGPGRGSKPREVLPGGPVRPGTRREG